MDADTFRRWDKTQLNPFFPGLEAEDLSYHPGVRNIILTDVRLMTLVDRYGLLACFFNAWPPKERIRPILYFI